MSKDELVGAYLEGRISRRMFIRGLVATGVSVTSAVAYSQVLSASVSGPTPRAVRQQYGDQYTPIDPNAGAGAAAATPVRAAPHFTG